MMTLDDYIKEVGTQVAAQRFGVTVRAIDSWRRRERMPNIRTVARILRSTGGVVNLDGIYLPYVQRADVETPTERAALR